MNFKLIKNKNGYFNLSINRGPSITMVDLEKNDLITLRDILDETIKNESTLEENRGYAYGYNPKTNKMERI